MGLVISRSSWGFGEAELVLAERLRRLLTIAYRWQLEHEAIRIGVPLTRACAETAGEQVLLSDQHGDVLLPEGTPAELEPGLQSAVSHAVSIALRNPVSSSPDRPLVELTMQLTASEEISLRVLPRRPGSDLLPVVVDRSPAMLRPAELSRHGLTPRQSDVMALILRGETTAGIANELGISPKTVEKHIESAYRALGSPVAHGGAPRPSGRLALRRRDGPRGRGSRPPPQRQLRASGRLGLGAGGPARPRR